MATVLFLVCRQLSSCSHMAEKRERERERERGSEGKCKLSVFLPVRALIPFMGAPPSRPNYLPRVPPLKTIILGGGFQHMSWQEIQILSVAFWRILGGSVTWPWYLQGGLTRGRKGERVSQRITMMYIQYWHLSTLKYSLFSKYVC